jgi:hypothetical protein
MASEPPLGAQMPEMLHDGVWLALIAAALGFIRWAIGASGANQTARIAALEAQVEIMAADRHKLQQDINSKLMGLGQGMIELMTALERLDARHVSLERARRTLAEVFPIEGASHD